MSLLKKARVHRSRIRKKRTRSRRKYSRHRHKYSPQRRKSTRPHRKSTRNRKVNMKGGMNLGSRLNPELWTMAALPARVHVLDEESVEDKVKKIIIAEGVPNFTVDRQREIEKLQGEIKKADVNKHRELFRKLVHELHLQCERKSVDRDEATQISTLAVEIAKRRSDNRQDIHQMAVAAACPCYAGPPPETMEPSVAVNEMIKRLVEHEMILICAEPIPELDAEVAQLPNWWPTDKNELLDLAAKRPVGFPLRGGYRLQRGPGRGMPPEFDQYDQIRRLLNAGILVVDEGEAADGPDEDEPSF